MKNFIQQKISGEADVNNFKSINQIISQIEILPFYFRNNKAWFQLNKNTVVLLRNRVAQLNKTPKKQTKINLFK